MIDFSNDRKEALHELARLYRIEHTYYDGLGRHRTAPPEAVLQVLRSLGAAVESESDLQDALRLRRRELDGWTLRPVNVVWAGESLPGVPIRLEDSQLSDECTVSLHLEADLVAQWTMRGEDLEWKRKVRIDGRDRQERFLKLKGEMPPGYYQLTLEGSSLRAKSLVVVAPSYAFQAERGRIWGLFAPLYSLYSEKSWGSASYRDLGKLIDWTSSLGGGFVGSLPIYASFLQEDPFSPSPYTPVSRLFWSEFFVDPRHSPDWDDCFDARVLAESAEFREEVGELRELPLVDYRREMALRRRILECLSRHRFSLVEKREPFLRWCDEREELMDYACFRALQEKLGGSWREWPEAFRAKKIEASRVPSESLHYHLYVQWLAENQLGEVLRSARAQDVGLYLDLPLGVHPDGYDVWSRPQLFVEKISGGAPPDGFFTEGQDWGFPPLHPQAQRDDGYRFYREVLRKLLGSSDLIRIDHAMSLQRLFWVPQGMTAKEGVYVYYPMEELLAVICLESHLEQCAIIGEDLGTVTDEVRESLEKRGIYRMYVGQFEIDVSQSPPLRAVPGKRIASLNTHDTPTAAGFWQARDIEDRVDLGLLTEAEAVKERGGRALIRRSFLQAFGVSGDELESEVQFEVLRKWLELLAESDAEFLLINLEDLWQEELPQNVPGTVEERPNWRRKAPESLEKLCKDPLLLDTLESIDRKRNHHR